jgi:hypothetical protein
VVGLGIDLKVVDWLCRLGKRVVRLTSGIQSLLEDFALSLGLFEVTSLFFLLNLFLFFIFLLSRLSMFFDGVEEKFLLQGLSFDTGGKREVILMVMEEGLRLFNFCFFFLFDPCFLPVLTLTQKSFRPVPYMLTSLPGYQLDMDLNARKLHFLLTFPFIHRYNFDFSLFRISKFKFSFFILIFSFSIINFSSLLLLPFSCGTLVILFWQRNVESIGDYLSKRTLDGLRFFSL